MNVVVYDGSSVYDEDHAVAEIACFVDSLRPEKRPNGHVVLRGDVDEVLEAANDAVSGTDYSFGWHPEYPGCIMYADCDWWND